MGTETVAIERWTVLQCLEKPNVYSGGVRTGCKTKLWNFKALGGVYDNLPLNYPPSNPLILNDSVLQFRQSFAIGPI